MADPEPYIVVWYILIDSDNRIFAEPDQAILGHGAKISDLTRAIMMEKTELLAQVSKERLEVWFCSLTLPNADLPDADTDHRNVTDQLSELVGCLDLSDDSRSPSTCKKLCGWARVPVLELGEYGALVVRIKEPRQHQAVPPDDYYRSAKLSRLARLEPNTVNDPSVYESLQENRQERIMDDCPEPDPDIPPLPLLYVGFGEFRDQVEHPDADLLDTELMNEVDQLADAACSLGYENVKKAQEHVQRIFSQGAPFNYEVGNGSKATTGGYLLASHGGPLVIIEYKRQIAAAEPQLASHFIRLALKLAEDIFCRWRQPGLGILIRGTYVSFHGLVMVDSQVRVLPLTHVFPCNDSELDRTPLYVAFGAACRLLARIEQDSLTLVSSLPPAIQSRRRLPYISSLLRVSDNDGQAGERINFEITDILTTGLEGKRFLYLASTTDPNPQRIIVKFSKQYGTDLHRFCASIQRAPRLLAIERLPGGWFGIAMEYFPSAKCVLESENLAACGEQWLHDIDDIVAEFHRKGYVHGDLRPPNFIVDGKRLLIIDFDWGGLASQATFPQKNLHPILRTSRSVTRITVEGDTLVKDYTKLHISDRLRGMSGVTGGVQGAGS